MKTSTIMAGAVALLAGLGAPAAAAPLTFSAVFGPEAPGATGSGSATIVIDIAANTIDIVADWAGLSAGTTVAHIHCCTALPGTGTAGVAVTPVTLPAFPVGVLAGSYSFLLSTDDPATYTSSFVTNSGGGTLPGAEAALLAGLEAGRAYFNIHTTAFPGGEIRGFLVPEPATLGLLGAGLLGLGAARRGMRRATPTSLAAA